MTILYINGFRSDRISASSDKVWHLQKAFPDEEVRAPVVPSRHYAALEVLTQEMRHAERPFADELILVGTSLGAWWAMHMSHLYAVPAVMLNPSLQPSINLSKYEGEMVDGREWSSEDTRSYEAWAGTEVLNDGIPRIIVMEKGDSVCPIDDTLQLIDLTKPYVPALRILGGGSHRFDDYDTMISAVKQLKNQAVC